MTPIYTFSELHIQQLHLFYQKTWWTKARTLDETRRGVQGSQICIGLVDDTSILRGFARVLTDYTYKALIFDVIIDEALQGQALGSELISLIKKHEDLKEVNHFELYCLPELMPFYEKHGFTREVGGIQLMRLSAS